MTSGTLFTKWATRGGWWVVWVRPLKSMDLCRALNSGFWVRFNKDSVAFFVGNLWSSSRIPVVLIFIFVFKLWSFGISWLDTKKSWSNSSSPLEPDDLRWSWSGIFLDSISLFAGKCSWSSSSLSTSRVLSHTIQLIFKLITLVHNRGRI